MGNFPAQGGAPGQGGGQGGEGHKIENEGVSVIQQSVLNFVGGGVTASDSGGKTVVTVPGFTASTTVIGRQQIFFPASCMVPELGANGTSQLQTRAIGTFGQVIQYIEFPRASDTFAYFDWFTPSNWNVTPIQTQAIAFWTTDIGTTQQIDLQIVGIARSDTEGIGSSAFGVGTGPWQDLQAGLNTLNHDVVVSAPIGGGGAKLDWIQWKLRRRIAGDLNPGALQLIGIKIQYEIDNGVGS